MAIAGVSPVDGQLILAGITSAVAAEQFWVASWARERRLPRWTGTCAALVAVLIGANALILNHHMEPGLERLLFIRYVAASLLPLTAVFLTAALARRRAPAWIVALCLSGVVARLILWPTTDLVYTHHLDGGWPVYGPLPPLLTIPFVVVSFGYVLRTLIRVGNNLDLAALFAAVAITAVVTVVGFATSPDPALAEQLNGWVLIPLFLALIVIVGRRQAATTRNREAQIVREAALADLAHQGMTASAIELLPEAETLLHEHAHEQPFVEAVYGITNAAAQRDAAEQAVLYRATHDELTGLLNRSELRNLLEDALSGPPLPITVLQLGVDSMRSVNDSFGHPVGDRILQAISERLQAILPASSLLARVDGDEFAVVVIGGEGSPADIAQRVLTALHLPYQLNGFTDTITVSVGVGSRPAESRRSDADGLLHDADIAMHRAKAGGGRSVAYFDDWMRAELLRTRGLERRLAKALDNDEIVLHYEPIVALSDRRPIAYEALARWRCEGEMISAASWIPVAEKTGHLIDIGRHLAELATGQLLDWRSAGAPIDVSLNVSARQLRTPDLSRALDEALVDGLDPQQLWLEVTESIAVDDDALNALKTLRDKGFRIVLDDFGTGYSSLHALGRLPIDIVKIDRSFVASLGDRSAHALVAAVVSIAEANGLDIVAEGIETEYQAERLVALGCKWGQGYLFGRAAAPDTFVPAPHSLAGLPPRAV